MPNHKVRIFLSGGGIWWLWWTGETQGMDVIEWDHYVGQLPIDLRMLGSWHCCAGGESSHGLALTLAHKWHMHTSQSSCGYIFLSRLWRLAVEFTCGSQGTLQMVPISPCSSLCIHSVLIVPNHFRQSLCLQSFSLRAREYQAPSVLPKDEFYSHRELANLCFS